jgi:hypothetical protein
MKSDQTMDRALGVEGRPDIIPALVMSAGGVV